MSSAFSRPKFLDKDFKPKPNPMFILWTYAVFF